MQNILDNCFPTHTMNQFKNISTFLIPNYLSKTVVLGQKAKIQDIAAEVVSQYLE